MSKVAIKGNASGTGTFTLEAPNSNTDRTLTLPDEAGTVLTSASDLSSVASTINAVDLGDVSIGTHTYTVTGSTSGSWTPRAGYLTYYYYKIGRLVHISGKVETQGTSSPSGNIRISTPYPFASNPSGGIYSYASAVVERTFSGARESLYAFGLTGNSYFEIWELDSAGGWNPLTSSTNPTLVESYFGFTYITD